MEFEECKSYNKVTHVIFDLDGTLRDTETIYERTFTDLVAKYGKTISASVKFKHQGSPLWTAISILIDELELPVSQEQLSDEFKRLCADRFSSIQLMKGAERLIRHFERNNIGMAIATSSDRESAKLKMADPSCGYSERCSGRQA